MWSPSTEAGNDPAVPCREQERSDVVAAEHRQAAFRRVQKPVILRRNIDVAWPIANPVTTAGNRRVQNTLHLFDAEMPDETGIRFL